MTQKCNWRSNFGELHKRHCERLCVVFFSPQRAGGARGGGARGHADPGGGACRRDDDDDQSLPANRERDHRGGRPMKTNDTMKKTLNVLKKKNLCLQKCELLNVPEFSSRQREVRV